MVVVLLSWCASALMSWSMQSGAWKLAGWVCECCSCCLDMLGLAASFRDASVPFWVADPILVCKLLMLVNKHLSTRLETRTKESNACVSFWVIKLCGVLKEIVGMIAPATNQTIVWGLSGSMCVRTRKMVNYAWGKQSQGKLWWRLVAILTCKSFVILEYRGERLIEPSSSWFPPKFPSG